MKKDLKNQKFGRLEALEEAGRNKNRCVIWKCKCDCGNTTYVISQSLTSGRTRSCGCLNREISTKHGLCHTRLYKIWAGMKARCYQKNNKKYYTYGARGIKVCQEWKDDFKKFYDWAMNNGYNDNLTIDRIDVNGDYEPNNCRWADIYTQNNNKTNNHYLEHNRRNTYYFRMGENIWCKLRLFS